jgi:hypothetical protein
VPHTTLSHGENGAQPESNYREILLHRAKSVSQRIPTVHMRYSLKAEITTAHIVLSAVIATIVGTAAATTIVGGRVIGIRIPMVRKVIVRGHAGRAQCRSTQERQKQVAARSILWLRAIIVLVVVVVGSHSLLLVVVRRRKWLLLCDVMVVSRILRKELLRWLGRAVVAVVPWLRRRRLSVAIGRWGGTRSTTTALSTAIVRVARGLGHSRLVRYVKLLHVARGNLRRQDPSRFVRNRNVQSRSRLRAGGNAHQQQSLAHGRGRSTMTWWWWR